MPTSNNNRDQNNKRTRSKRRRTKHNNNNNNNNKSKTTTKYPTWIFKTNSYYIFKIFIYSIILSICFIFGISILTIIFSLLCTFTIWILSPPNRKVDSNRYETPKRFLLTGSASGMSQHITKKLISQGYVILIFSPV